MADSDPSHADEKSGEELWQSILADVMTHTTTRRLPPKRILVLGDEGSGKSTFISKLQDRKYHAEEHPASSGLEYTFLDVKDEDSEDIISRMGVFSLCGDKDHALLLDHVLNKDNIDSTVAIVVVDLTRPWSILNSVKKWFGVLEDRINALGAGEKLEQCRTRLVKAFQSFTEEAVETKDKNPDEEQVVLDLEEGVFTTNIGIPLVVVATKVDAISVLSNNYDYRQEHLDFIQFHLRTLCLKYGAGCVYFGKDGKTKDALYRYLIHLGYGLPLSAKANVADTDSIFIPSGWDNATKANILTQGMQNISPNDAYGDVIRSPQHVEASQSNQVVAEDEQDFLKKQQPLLGKQPAGKGDALPPGDPKRANPLAKLGSIGGPTAPAATTAAAAPAASPTSKTAAAPPAAGGAAAPRARTGSASGTTPAAATAAAGKAGQAGKPAGGAQNADVLANFFNSLLSKKPPGKDDAPAAAT